MAFQQEPIQASVTSTQPVYCGKSLLPALLPFACNTWFQHSAMPTGCNQMLCVHGSEGDGSNQRQYSALRHSWPPHALTSVQLHPNPPARQVPPPPLCNPPAEPPLTPL